jgi:hypothetical protein
MHMPTETDQIKSLIRQLGEEEETVFDLAREAVGDGDPIHHLKVTRRKLQPEQPNPPIKAYSPRRAHVFHAAESFLAYIERFATGYPVVFADVAEARMAATLDEKATTGFEVVCLEPQPHPLMQPWADLLDRFIPIEGFALHVQKYRRAIVEPEAMALVLAAQQVRIAKEIEISSGFGKEFSRGIMARTRIEGTDKNVPIDIPDTITIEAPVFTATSPQRIQIDLTFDVQDDHVVVCMTASDYEMAKLEAFDEMLETMREKTGEGSNITLTTGRPHWNRWDYLAPDRG